MYICPVSCSYWRLIKEGFRQFTDVVGEDKKIEVKQLAQQEVVNGQLPAERYEELIGEPYPEIGDELI
jgi:hypothetical protein